jgi:hypothetical protein
MNDLLKTSPEFTASRGRVKCLFAANASRRILRRFPTASCGILALKAKKKASWLGYCRTILNGKLSSQLSCAKWAGVPGHGQMKPEQLEIAQLKREVVRLKAERDILKKAAAYFAKEST